MDETNTTLPPADGNIDASGAQFINLTSTITSRDNLREGAADLINLVATLPNLAAISPRLLRSTASTAPRCSSWAILWAASSAPPSWVPTPRAQR